MESGGTPTHKFDPFDVLQVGTPPNFSLWIFSLHDFVHVPNNENERSRFEHCQRDGPGRKERGTHSEKGQRSERRGAESCPARPQSACDAASQDAEEPCYDATGGEVVHDAVEVDGDESSEGERGPHDGAGQAGAPGV